MEALFTISATAPIAGELQVEIMRAIPIGPDVVEKNCGFPVSVGADPLTVGPCTFKADLLTGDDLQHYYYRLLWSGTLIYSPADPGTREHVRTQ